MQKIYLARSKRPGRVEGSSLAFYSELLNYYTVAALGAMPAMNKVVFSAIESPNI